MPENTNPPISPDVELSLEERINLTKIPVEEWTEATITGEGVFDVLMRANKAHLEQEFSKGRIKGGEYATVYLGSLQHVLQTSMEFVLQNRKMALDSLMMEKQIAIAEKELEQADIALEAAQQNLEKIPHEIELLKAQAKLTNTQADVAEEEVLLAKERVLLSKEEVLMAKEQLKKLPHEIDLLEAQAAHTNKQVEVADEEILLAKARVSLSAEEVLIAKERVLLTKEEVLIAKEQLKKIQPEIDHIIANTGLVEQNTANAITQNDTMIREQCKLAAEYDVLVGNIAKTAAETAYFEQRMVTEKAQTDGTVINPNSVIGTQNTLYKNQAEGFLRNAEQQAAKLLVDSWQIRRSTDDGVQANPTNKLDDINVGKAVTKLMQGVNIS